MPIQSHNWRRILSGSLLLLPLLLAGCPKPPSQATDELIKCRQERDALWMEAQNLQVANAEQAKHIQTLAQLGDKRLDLLFHVKAIEIGRYSGGVDLDGKGGDDAIRVYLKPIDYDGSVLKAAGSARIQFFDLTAPPEANCIGTYEFPVQTIGKHWDSGMVTYHYRFDCKWQKPPAHPDITVTLVFVEYLTGKTFTAQSLVRLKLPPSTQPSESQKPVMATAPASAPASGPCPPVVDSAPAPAATAANAPTSRPALTDTR